uniref:Integrase catalytic domain-containing protein n=1 Tax=Nicotiana tabacum TaxID=4097 RepID=A0A1S4B1G3_TOBAC|nr:PREDICTED: uncharacterized protein LOC107803468 [Nicotiana tabacum]
MDKGNKNIHSVDYESPKAGGMRWVKSENGHERLVYVSFSSPNKLTQKDLVRGLPNSRVTWIRVHKTKEETLEVLMVLVKKIQEKAKKGGITHNFSTPRTPQQNGIAERKNGTRRCGMENAHRLWNRQNSGQKQYDDVNCASFSVERKSTSGMVHFP